MAKMSRYCLMLSILGLSFLSCYFANDMDMEAENNLVNVEDVDIDSDTSHQVHVSDDIDEIIVKIEDMAAQAEKAVKEGILPIEYTEQLYSKMGQAFEELVDLTSETGNVYKFLNVKGIERIALPNIGIHYRPLKRQILLLIKNLFDVAPMSTTATIPIGMVDKLLDIFEYDDNLALKAHALDILYLWLPGNPMIQTRVMRMKGLEPFYQQVEKLDASVINQLMDLFNKILEEHINARRNDMQTSKTDHDRLVVYQRIGLLERLSIPNVCNGLINILETISSYNSGQKEMPLTIFKLMKNVKPYCINVYKAKPKQTKLFIELSKFIDDRKESARLEKLGLNILDTHAMLKEYANVFNAVSFKDEL